MAPVYAKAALVALRYGRRRKPAYRVTRKVNLHKWYWRETLPQLLLFLGLVGASVYHLATHSLLENADLGSLLWAGFFAAGLSRTVRNAWYGVPLRPAIAKWMRSLPTWSPLRRVAVRARNGRQR
jgi:hypothetical protein